MKKLLAIAFIMPTLNGLNFDLHDQLGKVTVVHFMATWCTNCQKEMTELQKFHADHKDVELIGVSVDKSRERDDVIKLMKTYGFPIGMVTDAKENGFGRPGSLPMTYVIDKKGDVRKIFSGGELLTESGLEHELSVL
jgi:thiol-disulfide isomerase/thioredoxin